MKIFKKPSRPEISILGLSCLVHVLTLFYIGTVLHHRNFLRTRCFELEESFGKSLARNAKTEELNRVRELLMTPLDIQIKSNLLFRLRYPAMYDMVELNNAAQKAFDKEVLKKKKAKE